MIVKLNGCTSWWAIIKNYNVLWNKDSNNRKKNLIPKPSTILFLKAKVKSCSDKAINFHCKEIPGAVSNYTSLTVKLIDFILKR